MDTKKSLHDLTFLIHYFRDSPERERNLVTVCRWIRRRFISARIAICETAAERCIPPDLEKDLGGIEYFRQDFRTPEQYLHRTRALNFLAKKVETPFAAVYDSDVVFPEAQIADALHWLRLDKADAVYPYDDNFIRFREGPTAHFVKTLDVDNLANSRARLLEFPGSVGGAVLVRLDWYLRVGGENEAFVGYGEEDLERYHRFSTLGRVKRVKGPLYHLRHPTSPHTIEDHPFFAGNRAEHQKVKALTPSELEAYIATWPTRALRGA